MRAVATIIRSLVVSLGAAALVIALVFVLLYIISSAAR